MINNPILFGFLLSLLFFILIGLLSALKRKSTTNDYLLAGQNVKPWLTALSAVATNNSGFMFIGMIGFTYNNGLSSIWLAFGWIIGDLLISFIVHPKLRDQAEKTKSLSYSELIGKWDNKNFSKVRILAALLTVIFLCVYAAAQLKAGGKALSVLLGWEVNTGALIGTAIVFLYCYAGGIRASIWTDAAQSFVMIIAMSLLLFVGLNEMGGIEATVFKLEEISNTYLSILPKSIDQNNLIIGLIIYIFSWMFGGIAVAGQPHIMTRFMVINKSKNMSRVRWYYYSWYSIFFMLTIGVGMLSRLYLNEVSSFDEEMALPNLATKLLPAILVGVILSGLFAATMSTADSQVLSCTASITRDLFAKKTPSLIVTKIITLVVCCLSLIISLLAPTNVFDLVLFAWSGLGCAFTPLLLIYIFKKPINEMQAIAMILIGISTAIIWKYSGLDQYIYEGFPGIFMGLACYFFSHQIISIRRLDK